MKHKIQSLVSSFQDKIYCMNYKLYTNSNCRRSNFLANNNSEVLLLKRPNEPLKENGPSLVGYNAKRDNYRR